MTVTVSFTGWNEGVSDYAWLKRYLQSPHPSGNFQCPGELSRWHLNENSLHLLHNQFYGNDGKFWKGKNSLTTLLPCLHIWSAIQLKMIFLTWHYEQNLEMFFSQLDWGSMSECLQTRKECFGDRKEMAKCFSASGEMHSWPGRTCHCPPRIK